MLFLADDLRKPETRTNKVLFTLQRIIIKIESKIMDTAEKDEVQFIEQTFRVPFDKRDICLYMIKTLHTSFTIRGFTTNIRHMEHDAKYYIKANISWRSKCLP